MLDDLTKLADRGAGQGFFGNNGGAGSEVDFDAELIDRAGRVAGYRVAFEQARDEGSVLSGRREDDRPVVVGRGLYFRSQGSPPAQRRFP